MDRRKFLAKTGLALAGAGAAGCGSQPSGSAAVHTQPQITWRLTSSFPRALDTIFGAATQLAERVSALTAGRFKIIAYEAGEMVPPFQVLDAVQQGTVQMGHTASYYFKGKNPILAFDCTVPFGLTARQQNAWYYYGGGLDMMRHAFSDFGIIPFPGGNTGMQMGGWFRREISSMQDLAGLRMRIPGLGGEVMHRLGVTVQVLGGGDIFPALETGAIDATEWVGPYDDEKLGFHKVAPYYYYPGWWEPGPSLSFYVNESAWFKLPSEYQNALEVAAAEANVHMLANYDAKNPEALGRLLEQGVQMRAFSDDIMTAAQKISFELLDEFAAQDVAYDKVYQSWKKFRESSYQWFSTAEMAFSRFAFSL
ncbi:MAG: TRAP transporter substrate-binding protein [Acidobacteria bacterium]|nr:TRAP transporter substrate-binding protein [Acidobacteriota bacterium]